MITFFKSLPNHMKRAVDNIIRNFGNAASSIFATTVTLMLIMLFTVLALNIGSFTVNVEKNIQILARIDRVVPAEQYTRIEEQIKALEHVDKVQFSSEKEQLEKLMTKDDKGNKYESFKTENPLPAAFYIDVKEGKYVQTVAKNIEKIDGILDTNFGGDSVTAMVNGFNSLRYGGGIFIVLLCFLTIFMISNTIKINIYNRREEIAIMRNVGASNSYIKIPFLIEGIIIGILGAIIPVLITIFGYGFLYDFMDGKFFSPMFLMQPPIPFVFVISAILLGSGMLVGLFGSLVSVNKYLKFKR